MDQTDNPHKIGQTYRLLALCARAEGHPLFYEHLAGQLDRFEDWHELPAQAELHGMAPLLRHHLHQAGASIPIETRQILDGLYVRHRAVNRIHTQTLLQVNSLFVQAGIRALLLKGLGLAHQCYPNPVLRPVSDIDLLIHWQDARPALALLSGAGFRADSLPSPPGIVSAELTADSPLKDGLSIRVELHFAEENPHEYDRLVDFPRNLTIDGQVVHIPDVLPTMRYLSRHYRRHLFAATNAKPLQLKWIADLISLAEQHAETIDWKSLRRSDPALLKQFEVFYSLTPPPARMTDMMKWITTANPPPKGLNQYPSGWPQQTFSRWKHMGWLKFLLRTFSSPSEWWLRLYYGIDKRLVPFYGAVIYPIQILIRILSTFTHLSNTP